MNNSASLSNSPTAVVGVAVVMMAVASSALSNEFLTVPLDTQDDISPLAGAYQYQGRGPESSCSQIKTLSQSAAMTDRHQFAKEVSDYYAALLEKQEPLGEEYEKILVDKLWDLYES